MKTAWIAGGLAVGVLVAGAAAAHHSFAMFDTGKTQAIKGAVHEFQWTNPHSWIEVDVPTADGKTERWSVELNSPNNLTRQGWNRKVMQPGDPVVVVVNPLRDGQKGGLFYAIALPDGKMLRDPRVAAGPIAVTLPKGCVVTDNKSC